MIDGLESLKLKVEYLQKLVDSKQNDIENLKEAFASNVNYYNKLVEKQKLILEKLKANLNSMQTLNGEQKRMFVIDEAVLALNESFQKASNYQLSSSLPQSSSLLTSSQHSQADVVFPHLGNFLKHLNMSANMVCDASSALFLQPKFKLAKNSRHTATIAIGIPTIKREKTSYLLETLKSLFDAMNELDKLDALVVVMIAEVSSF